MSNRQGEQGSVSNGQPPGVPSTHSSECNFDEDNLLEQDNVQEDPPVIQIERDLDELTYSGAAINDLEVQLTRTKHLYQQVLVDGKLKVDGLRRKLHTHIIKSEPFIEIWRKARQVQEMSNRAAARYDKANSQHLAAKEMIRVAESQLAACRAEQLSKPGEEPPSPSPFDLAWQEMLNHATSKVVVTEKERRDSELAHRRVLEECRKVMEDYRNIERKLRTHIIKSRPYFQERYVVNRHLMSLKETMKGLEQKINESKQSYSASLKRLEALNTEMHERRGTFSGPRSRFHLDPRQVASAGSTPDLRRSNKVKDRDEVDSKSVDSMHLAGDYSGSVGSLPSVGVPSNSQSPCSESDSRSLDSEQRLPNSELKADERPIALGVTPPSPDESSTSLPNPQNSDAKLLPLHSDTSLPNSSESPLYSDISSRNIACSPSSLDRSETFPPSLSASPSDSQQSGSGSEEERISQVASELVIQCLASAVNILDHESESSDGT